MNQRDSGSGGTINNPSASTPARLGRSLATTQARQNFKLAVAAFNERRLPDAVRLFESVLAVHPHAFDPNYLVALTRSRSGDYEAALPNYDRALIARPDHVEANYNRANALLKLRRFQEAALSASETLRLRPGFPEAHKILGDALVGLNRISDAETCYRRALELRGGYLPALRELCKLLMRVQRYDDAAVALLELLKLQADCRYALGALIFCKMRCCEWDELPRLNEELLLGIRSHRLVAWPLVLLTLPSTLADQLTNARHHSEARAPVPTRKRPHRERIRLAYLSADFNRHPVSELAVGLFERHARSRFEIIGISFGEDDGSEVRRRLEKAFDRFIDVRRLGDLQIASLLAEMGVEIAVDLMGYTEEARPGILAHRPAPIQVSYLGFPGTMGTGHIDYIIADRHVIPDEEKQLYAEQVVHLPDTYLVNDDRRWISDAAQTRAMHGLDDGAFVFCCFCQSHKITPDVFDLWMRLLRKVPGSVLWLHGINESAKRNVRQTAALHGVAPHRLVFAAFLANISEHLARHRLADLALDTLPYNGHATTSDALWAGLPVITRTGATFAGRVAASLLHAVGLPELVTSTAGECEELAVRLATDRPLLEQIREKLARNRLTHPLFNTDRFRRHLEAAYRTMWDLWQRGESPRSFSLEAIPSPNQAPHGGAGGSASSLAPACS